MRYYSLKKVDKYLPSIKRILEQDIEKCKIGEKVSVLAMWLPSHCARNKSVFESHIVVRNYLGISEKEYRKMLSNLRNAYRLQKN